MPPFPRITYRPVFAALLLGGLLIAGCATPPAPPAPAAATALEDAEPQPTLVPVVRYGRYTLAELMPEPAQRDLPQQVVEITMPPESNATVGDAMRHALARTGYRLCETQEVAALYALTLPAAHLRLGPLMLRDVLRVLAGPAWMLSVDDATRVVCFRRALAPDMPGNAVNVKQPQITEPEEVLP